MSCFEIISLLIVVVAFSFYVFVHGKCQKLTYISTGMKHTFVNMEFRWLNNQYGVWLKLKITWVDPDLINILSRWTSCIPVPIFNNRAQSTDPRSVPVYKYLWCIQRPYDSGNAVNISRISSKMNDKIVLISPLNWGRSRWLWSDVSARCK